MPPYHVCCYPVPLLQGTKVIVKTFCYQVSQSGHELLIIFEKGVLTHSQQLTENVQNVQSGLNIPGVLLKTHSTFVKQHTGIYSEL